MLVFSGFRWIIWIIISCCFHVHWTSYNNFIIRFIKQTSKALYPNVLLSAKLNYSTLYLSLTLIFLPAHSFSISLREYFIFIFLSSLFLSSLKNFSFIPSCLKKKKKNKMAAREIFPFFPLNPISFFFFF